jgi:hypothetical protein
MSEVFSDIQKGCFDAHRRIRRWRFSLLAQRERDAALIRSSRAAIDRSIQLLSDTHTHKPRSVEASRDFRAGVASRLRSQRNHRDDSLR